MNQLLQTRDVAASTIKHYEAQLPDFKLFVDEHGLNVHTFLSYKRWLAQRSDISVSTKNARLYSAKVVLMEGHRLGQLPNVFAGIKGFRENKGHKKFGFNDQEVAKAVQCDDIRLTAMLYLLAYQGLRQKEVVALDVSDINFLQKTALIHSKGSDGKEIIHLHPKTIELLQNYLKKYNLKSGALFTNVSNNSKGQRISIRGLRSTVKNYLESLKIEGNIHGFRHWFTTRLVKKAAQEGKSLFWVQQHTRHKNLETLKRYFDEVEFKDDLPTFYSALE